MPYPGSLVHLTNLEQLCDIWLNQGSLWGDVRGTEEASAGGPRNEAARAAMSQNMWQMDSTPQYIGQNGLDLGASLSAIGLLLPE